MLRVVSGETDLEVPGHRCEQPATLFPPPSSPDSCSLQSQPGCPLCSYSRNCCKDGLLLRETFALTIFAHPPGDSESMKLQFENVTAIMQMVVFPKVQSVPSICQKMTLLPSTPIISSFSLRPRFGGRQTVPMCLPRPSWVIIRWGFLAHQQDPPGCPREGVLVSLFIRSPASLQGSQPTTTLIPQELFPGNRVIILVIYPPLYL